MTVAEEVARAVQIASAPQEVANSIPPTAEEVANSSAARAPSTSLPSHISSSTDTVTIQRSPAFSLSSSNGEVDESSFENLSSIGGCCWSSIVSDKSMYLQVTEKQRKQVGRIWWSGRDQEMLNLKERSPAQTVVFNSTGQVWHSTGKSTMSRRVGPQTLKEVMNKLYVSSMT